jgi:hypothetical protein
MNEEKIELLRKAYAYIKDENYDKLKDKLEKNFDDREKLETRTSDLIVAVKLVRNPALSSQINDEISQNQKELKVFDHNIGLVLEKLAYRLIIEFIVESTQARNIPA